MKLDRNLQKQILTALENVYPDSLLVASLPGYSNGRNFMGNLFYLQEHGMIEGGDIREPGQCRSMVDAQITKVGLDFLADDGGLPEILGLITMKIDIRDIREALSNGLIKAGVDDRQCSEILDTVGHKSKEELRIMILGLLEQAAADRLLPVSLKKGDKGLKYDSVERSLPER